MGLGVPLRRLGQLTLRQGDYERAGACIRESLTLNIDLRDKRAIAACMAAAAALRAAQGRLVHGGRLCGAADALLESMHTQMHPFDQEQYECTLVALRTQLDPAAFDAGLTEGRALTLEQAIDLAQEETDG